MPTNAALHQPRQRRIIPPASVDTVQSSYDETAAVSLLYIQGGQGNLAI